MARVTRRKFLKASGASALAAKTSGMAAVLAAGKAAAYAQATTVHWLKWNDFVPAGDEILRQSMLAEAEKALGFKINLETIGLNDLQARATAAIQVNAGPDIALNPATGVSSNQQEIWHAGFRQRRGRDHPQGCCQTDQSLCPAGFLSCVPSPVLASPRSVNCAARISPAKTVSHTCTSRPRRGLSRTALPNEGSPSTLTLLRPASSTLCSGIRQGATLLDPRRRRPGAKRPQPKIVAKERHRLRSIRALGIDVGMSRRKAPNHAWRHLFHTSALDAGIGETIINAIMGYAATNVRQTYGEVRLATAAKAIASIPLPGVCEPDAARVGLPAWPEPRG